MNCGEHLQTIYGHQRPVDDLSFDVRPAASPAVCSSRCGRSVTSPEPAARPVGAMTAFGVLFQMCVLGRGVPELLEYVLRAQPRALARHASIVLSRSLACIALLRRSRCYELELSNDPKANARFVAELAAKDLAGEHKDGRHAA